MKNIPWSISALFVCVLFCNPIHAVEPVVVANLPEQGDPPLEGKNSITNIKAIKTSNGRWKVSLDYFSKGGGQLKTFINIAWSVDASGPQNNAETQYKGIDLLAIQGAHHIENELPYPWQTGGMTTKYVVATLVQGYASDRKTLVSENIPLVVAWPSPEIWMADNEIQDKSEAEVVRKASDQIDGGNLIDSKRLLERLLTKKPNVDSAYLELARIAMKSNWGPEGLHQAEVLIDSALRIQPMSADALVLQGYVYKNQGRLNEAESIFGKASNTKTNNLWLWINWGELRESQGNANGAIDKYMKATNQKPTHDRNDRARQLGYERLISIYRARKDVHRLNDLYKNRMNDYSDNACFRSAYARFALQQLGEFQKSLDLAKDATESICIEANGKQILGLAYYAMWMNAESADKNGYLNQARILYPASARLLFDLSASERTANAVKKLIAGGERIDQLDNQRASALAYAVRQKDYETAKRLLSFGARPELIVGNFELPVAILPLLEGDYDGIIELRKIGVDYSKITYQGISLLQYAKKIKDEKLIRALGKSPSNI